MKTYEHLKTTILVPTSWDDITLGVYEGVINLKPLTHRENLNMIAQLCSIDVNILTQWPAEIFNLLMGDITFIFKDAQITPSSTCNIGGVTFSVANEERLTLGEWIDAEQAQKEEAGIISGVLAVVCRPAGEAYDPTKNEDRQRLFASQPVSAVLGVMGFFLQCSQIYKGTTTNFLAIKEAVDLLPRRIKILQRPGGGIKLSRIWLIMKYYALRLLLHYRLAKLLRFYNTSAIKITQKKRSTNMIKNL